MIKPALVDISVLMLFHARPDHFRRVWEVVKRARPARLFLYQDGPRMVDSEGKMVTSVHESKDWDGLQSCRALVADDQIDWECEVHRNYREVNQGCDPSGFLSQQWAFSLTDKCIVLEDDVVPSLSFFAFCKEMLDRYEKDERITMIAGFNTDEQTVLPSSMKCSTGDGDDFVGENVQPDYFFTRVFSIWGWASWSRVILNRDGEYGFVRDEAQFELLKQKVTQYNQKKSMPQMCLDHAASGKQYFESIFWAYMLLHDGLAVMPRVNMVNNVGMDSGTHYSAQLHLLPARLRRQFTMGRYDLTFPLHHPSVVEEYPDYQRRFYLVNAWNNPWRKVQYSVEELWLNLRHGNFGQIRKALCNRIRKTLGLQRAS